MNPLLSMHEWGHLHHPANPHRFAGWFSRIGHDYRFWLTIGAIVYVATIIELILMAWQGNVPRELVPPVFPFYQF